MAFADEPAMLDVANILEGYGFENGEFEYLDIVRVFFPYEDDEHYDITLQCQKIEKGNEIVT